MPPRPTGSRSWRWIGSTLALLAFAQAMPASRLFGQEPAHPPSKDDERAGRLDEMRGLVGGLRAYKVDRGERVPVALRHEPLQRWNDPTRENSDGALWVWGTSGRPVAAVAVELNARYRTGESWAHEFVSLSTGTIEVEGGEGFENESSELPPRPDEMLRWAPKGPGLEFREIPGAPAPARGEAERLRQMKSLVSRFSAQEYYGQTRQTDTLRPLVQPVLRYADAAGGLVDGAVFIFAHGTNPEVLLLVEAQGRDPEHASWRYGLAQLTRAGPTVRLDQKDVWTRPTTPTVSPGDPYFATRRPRIPPGRDPKPGTRDET